jgi:TPR repeat/Tetratricopeptide repeat
MFPEALVACEHASRIQPNNAQVINSRGIVLHKAARFSEAIASFDKAVSLNPRYADAHINRGLSMRETGRLDEAIASFERAIQLDPDSPEGHYNRGLTYLLLGDLVQGWAEYEWRWKAKVVTTTHHLSQPRWDGGDIASKRLLLHAEQGFGDAIQMARFVPLLSRRCRRIILECPPSLFRIFGSLDANVELVRLGDPLPEFDVHCPMMSLPFALRTTLETIPAKTPYLRANSEMVDRWSSRILNGSKKMRVGLVWAGRPELKHDHNRSLRLEQFGPLFKIDNLQLYSLQKGPAADQIHSLSHQTTLIDHTSELNDFADTAALIENLDLVISVDTAVAHLAGAMGKATWILLSYVPDWRWLLNREDTPWYPTMRLLRQSTSGNWDELFNRVAKDLADRAK